MGRTGYNIYKRKDGRWEGRYVKGFKENGRVAYGYVYAKSFAEVKDRIKIRQTKPAPEITSYANATLGELALAWLAHKSMYIKKSTYSRYQERLRLHILPWFGKYQISRMTSHDLERFARAKLQSGRKDRDGGLSSKTVRDLLTAIKAILEYAKEEGFDAGGIGAIPYPKDDQKEMRVLAKHEQMALEKVLLNETNIHKLGVMIGLYTGLRVGEICALQWGDISIKEHVVYVRKTVQRVKNAAEQGTKTLKMIDSPKSKSSIRQVPLPVFLAEFLSEYRGSEKAYVLTASEKVIPETRTLQKKFKDYLQDADMEDANFHCLRHTFATRCVEAGVDVKSLSEMLGHSNVNITLGRYVHSTMDQKRACVNKLVRFMGA